MPKSMVRNMRIKLIFLWQAKNFEKTVSTIKYHNSTSYRESNLKNVESFCNVFNKSSLHITKKNAFSLESIGLFQCFYPYNNNLSSKCVITFDTLLTVMNKASLISLIILCSLLGDS